MTPLEAAKLLASSGIPIFVAPYSDNRLGFALPVGWEKSLADPRSIDEWNPGMALCAVTGHGLDAIDVDPRNGGSIDALKEALGGTLPRIYGVQRTPSGGEHYLIASLGVRKIQNVVPGVDIQAGNDEGVGRGFIFIAPTVRDSKADGERRSYEWFIEPHDLDDLLIGDDSGAGLAALVEAAHGRSKGQLSVDGVYQGPHYEELEQARKDEADEHQAGQIESWRRTLTKAADWPVGHRDERGRGWEALAYQSAWALAKMAACPWMSLDEQEAEELYHEILPPEIADDENCAGKWYDGIVEKASGETVDLPPWVIRGDVQDDFGRVGLPIVDVANVALAAQWLDEELGCRRLSGLFRRKSDLIYTPRVDEEGYQEPENPYDHDGPAQVRRVTPLMLSKRVDMSHRVVRVLKNGTMQPALFPRESAERSMELLDQRPNLKVLRMVTHTPVARADGSILDQPGFDAASGVLYLPERGLHVEPVPEQPDDADVRAASKVLLDMVQDFPFVSDHDRANYLGCLFIPLIRSIVPPPYKMLIIGAPQRGSGKSLLALLMRIIHGGVFRSEVPHDEEEKRKVITSILDSTSAPIVQFDNLSGQLKSSTLDGLLTSAVWTDRRLGVQVNLELVNDRLWVATGNNVHLGGDLERRVLWCTINARLEKPELRPVDSFHIKDLEEWVSDNRGELIHALLVIVRAWAAAGMQTQKQTTSDSFGRLVSVLQALLQTAGIPGEVGHEDASPVRSDPDAEELATFLHAVRRVKGEEPWTVRELFENAGSDFADEGDLHKDELPGDLGDKLHHNRAGAIKSMGKWLSFRNERLADGMMIKATGGGGNQAMRWRVVVVPREGVTVD